MPVSESCMLYDEEFCKILRHVAFRQTEVTFFSVFEIPASDDNDRSFSYPRMNILWRDEI